MFSFLEQPSTGQTATNEQETEKKEGGGDDFFSFLPKIELPTELDIPKFEVPLDLPGVTGGGETATTTSNSTDPSAPPLSNSDSDSGWGNWGLPTLELPVEMPKIELPVDLEMPKMDIPGIPSSPDNSSTTTGTLGQGQGQGQGTTDLRDLRGGGENDTINPRSPPSVERKEAQQSIHMTTTPNNNNNYNNQNQNSTINRPPPESLEEIDLITVPPMTKEQEQALFQQFSIWYKNQADQYKSRTGEWPPNYDPQREFVSWRQKYIHDKTIQYRNVLKQRFVAMKQQRGETVDLEGYQKKQMANQQQMGRQQQQQQIGQQQPQQQMGRQQQQIGQQNTPPLDSKQETPPQPPTMGSQNVSSVTNNGSYNSSPQSYSHGQTPTSTTSPVSSAPSSPLNQNNSGDTPPAPPKATQEKSVSFFGLPSSSSSSSSLSSPPPSPNPTTPTSQSITSPENVSSIIKNENNQNSSSNESNSSINSGEESTSTNNEKKNDAITEEYLEFIGNKQNKGGKKGHNKDLTNPDAAFNDPNMKTIGSPKKGKPNSPRTERNGEVEAGTTPTTPGLVLKPPPKNKNKNKDKEDEQAGSSDNQEKKSKLSFWGKSKNKNNTGTETESKDGDNNEDDEDNNVGNEDDEFGNEESTNTDKNKSKKKSLGSPRVRLKLADIPVLTPNQSRVLGEFRNMLINKGVKVRKLGNNGKMQSRTFTLDPRNNTIRWDTQKLLGGSSACIKIEDIEEIRESAEPSEVVMNSGADRKKCITFLLAGGKEIVVECVSDHFAKIFATCFSLMKQENDRKVAEAWEKKHPPGAGAFR